MRTKLRVALVAAAIALSFAVAPVAVASPDNDTAANCSDQRLEVETDGRQYTLAGQLCVPGSRARGVQVLSAGGTYTSWYWDSPVQSDRLSYVQDALADGYATFAYDRLGLGESERPPGATLTLSDDADVLHQVVSWVGQRYDDVTLVGHSLGTLIAIEESARYRDADRLVATGMRHGGNPAGLGATFGSLYPACLDPVTRGYDCDYLTTRPGRRGEIFYSDTADPAVITYDEAHKSVYPVGHAATTGPQLPPVVSAASDVSVPVLVVLGDHDMNFCAPVLALMCTPSAIRATEALAYPKAPRLDVHVEPGAGHNLTLHPSAPRTQDAIDEWIRAQDER